MYALQAWLIQQSRKKDIDTTMIVVQPVHTIQLALHLPEIHPLKRYSPDYWMHSSLLLLLLLLLIVI